MPDDSKTPKLPVAITARGAKRGQKPGKGHPAFIAQTLGQGGQKRGLKAGPPALDAARSSYLKAQWSGPGDRRAPAGIVRRDEV